MFDHLSIAVRSIAQAEPFYDAVMAALGHPKVGSNSGWIGYGLRADLEHPRRVYLSILQDPDTAASPARHWAFAVPDRGAVDAFWQAGLKAGGTDDGPPGVRPEYHETYYAAFLIDPDGNRIEAVCHMAAAV